MAASHRRGSNQCWTKHAGIERAAGGGPLTESRRGRREERGQTAAQRVTGLPTSPAPDVSRRERRQLRAAAEAAHRRRVASRPDTGARVVCTSTKIGLKLRNSPTSDLKQSVQKNTYSYVNAAIYKICSSI